MPSERKRSSVKLVSLFNCNEYISADVLRSHFVHKSFDNIITLGGIHTLGVDILTKSLGDSTVIDVICSGLWTDPSCLSPYKL